MPNASGVDGAKNIFKNVFIFKNNFVSLRRNKFYPESIFPLGANQNLHNILSFDGYIERNGLLTANKPSDDNGARQTINILVPCTSPRVEVNDNIFCKAGRFVFKLPTNKNVTA